MKNFMLIIQIMLMKFVLLKAPCAMSAAPEVDKNWEILNHDEDVAVYRSVKSLDKIFTFRGLGLVEASIPKLIALMSDPHRMPEWVFNCEEGQLVERNFKESDRVPDPSPYYQIFYGVTAVPWPLTPRDYVLKAQISYEKAKNSALPKNVTIAMRSTDHPKKPRVEGRVRMPVMESFIVMTPDEQNENKTWLDFSVTTDPGGAIPAWVTRMASRDIPRKTLVNLRRLAKTEDYNKGLEKLVYYHYQLQARK